MRRLLLFLFLATCTLVSAQTARWQRALGANDVLELVFSDAVPTREPQLPTVPGTTFTRLGVTDGISVVNGVASRSVVITYRFRLQAGTQVQIPAFEVQTNMGALTVAEFRASATASPTDNLGRSSLTAPANSYWAGEVFPLTYAVSAPRRLDPNIAGDIEWNSAPLVTEGWSPPESEATTVNGELQTSFRFRTNAYAKTPGRHTLEAAHQLVNIHAGVGLGFGMFARNVEQLTVTSNRPEITIRPLPGGAPAGFQGGVGRFTLESTVVPARVTVGEPITWTLTLAGAGNWPDIASLPVREVSRDFQPVQPKAKRTPVEGRLFQATLSEDVVLVPTRPGTYKLGPVSYSYFDPADGQYHTIKTDEATVEVTDPSGLATKGAPPAAPAPAVRPIAAEGKLPGAPPPPDAIPRDPLPGAGNAALPLAPGLFRALLAAGPAALLAAWLALSWRHATLTDPLRPRRLALRDLKATLAALRREGDAPARRARLLLDWQRTSARLWGVSHAAPPPSAMTEAQWTALWLEADRAMYSASGQLPADWAQRAEAAVAAQRLPSLNPFKLLLPRHLFPFFALAVALLLAPAAPAAPAQPTGPAIDYRAGRFAAAEKQWRAALKANPRDWIGRHNLSLALAQQDRWAEAAAHATVAFVQHPRDPSVRWHLDPILMKASFAPEPLVPFLQHQWRQEVARHASPGEWELVLAGASLLGSLAIALLLLRAHGWRSPWLHRGALAGLLVAGAAGTAGYIGRQAYGPAADRGAVLAWRAGTLRSIPTEADTAQKTTPLAAGSIAVADRAFLGWVHLTFANGQTGWVRGEEVIPFWR